MPAVIALTKEEKAEAERLRVARIKEEHNSMAHIERLKGVKEVRTGMEWHDYREVDAQGDEKVQKRARLTADAELADGRVIHADATNAVDLQRSLFTKVKKAIEEMPVDTGRDEVLAKKLGVRAVWVRHDKNTGGLEATAELADNVRVQLTGMDSASLENALREAIAKVRAKGKDK